MTGKEMTGKEMTRKEMTGKEMTDNVNHPAHYTAGKIECIDALREALGLDGFVDYCRGNAMKYCWRYGLKAEGPEDLEKAAWYLMRAAKELKSS